jgi:predicted dehydrogenase
MVTRRSVLVMGGAAMYARAVKLPRKVRVGMLGLAPGTHFGEIINPLDQLPDVEIVAISDPKAAAMEAFRKRNARFAGVKIYADYRQMLDKEQLDVVSVCNPDGERAAAVIECAQRKLNVVAEKPLATTRADLIRVKKAVNGTEIKLGMLLNMRYDSKYKALKEIASSGELGEVIQISSQKSYKLGSRPDWFKKQESYGSSILWIGIHMIDLMRFTSGRRYTHASSFMGRVGFPEVGEMETTTTTSFRLDNGGTATLHMDYCMPATNPTHGDDRLRLAGTKGIAEYMAATGVTLATGASKPAKVTTLPPNGSLFTDYLEFAYNGKPATLSHEEIWAANDATMAAHEAAVKSTVVAVS